MLSADLRCGVTILGSTGSIGRNTLDVIERNPEKFRVVALTAAGNDKLLLSQCLQFKPEVAVLLDADAAERLRTALQQHGSPTQVCCGELPLAEVAQHPTAEVVVAGIVGAAGLPPTLAAVEAGKRVLLANKEALVMSGTLLLEAASRSAAVLLPLDSEHNALFQCMPEGYRCGSPAEGVQSLILTASGGPFRETPIEALASVTPEQACAHPNWVMGPKISVDSATMMNKGLELVEATLLFAMPSESVEIVIHPASIVHSMVRYQDGSILAQLGKPDMRTPIAHSLAWPKRIAAGVEPLDFTAHAVRLEFYPPDFERFPCLKLAQCAAQVGGTAPTALNAANEVAVSAFLAQRLRFTDIAWVVEATLEQIDASAAHSLSEILARDAQARQWADQLCAERKLSA